MTNCTCTHSNRLDYQYKPVKGYFSSLEEIRDYAVDRNDIVLIQLINQTILNGYKLTK